MYRLQIYEEKINPANVLQDLFLIYTVSKVSA